MAKHMTQREALATFKAEIVPEVQKKRPNDKPAVREAWVNYIDQLHRERLISDHQADSWDNPF
jgi:hypothetical protein